MKWVLDSDRPIYIQLVEQMQKLIISGYFPPGGRLPSVREMAAEAVVNPNTMQKAYACLEKDGLIITLSTNGRVVTEDTALIEALRSRQADRYLQDFKTRMMELGYTAKDVAVLVEKLYEEEKDV